MWVGTTGWHSKSPTMNSKTTMIIINLAQSTLARLLAQRRVIVVGRLVSDFVG